jgi:hypothetical protein
MELRKQESKKGFFFSPEEASVSPHLGPLLPAAAARTGICLRHRGDGRRGDLAVAGGERGGRASPLVPLRRDDDVARLGGCGGAVVRR